MTSLEVLLTFSLADVLRAVLWLFAALPFAFVLYWMIVGIIVGLAALLGAYGDDFDYEERILARDR